MWVNPLTAKLFNCNFHPLEVVSRWRDPQLQVSVSDKTEVNYFQILLIDVTFQKVIPNVPNEKKNIIWTGG